MRHATGFEIGKFYSLSDIWNILGVTEIDRTLKWQNTIYDFCGTYYVLCQAYHSHEGMFSECKLHLGEMHCYGNPGVPLQLSMAAELLSEEKSINLFFRKSKQSDYTYLGHGKFRGLDDGLTSPLYIHWAIDSEDRLLPLREHISKFRKFCQSYVYDTWPDDSTLELLLDQLALAAAIEEVQVNTCRFGDGTHYDSAILKHEAMRSDLLSSVISVLLSFTYSWMALETMLEALPLPNVPKNLKAGTKPIDRCIYYLKRSLPVSYNETLMPGYDTTLERFRKLVASMSRYSKHVGKFDLQPHMNRWGLGVDKIRRIRNKYIHGALQMPELFDEESGMEGPCDDMLFELSTRITLFTMQLVLYAQIKERNILLTRSVGEHKKGDCASEAVRSLHIIERETT